MLSTLPNKKQRITYLTLSVALWKNGKTDRNSVHRNVTCTGKISHRKSRNYRKHRKQGRQFMRMDQRQPELPEAINALLPHLFQNSTDRYGHKAGYEASCYFPCDKKCRNQGWKRNCPNQHQTGTAGQIGCQNEPAKRSGNYQ